MTEPLDEELSRQIVKMQSGVLAMACGVIGGLSLFTMTAWLLIKGGPSVGSHLKLLNQYLIGYSVTWTGSLVGLAYGAVIGAIVGWTLGRIYNTVARRRVKRVASSR